MLSDINAIAADVLAPGDQENEFECFIKNG